LFAVFCVWGFARVRLKNVGGHWYGVVGVTAHRYRTLNEKLVANLGYFWAVLDDAQLRENL
jgi:hypothetical protein